MKSYKKYFTCLLSFIAFTCIVSCSNNTGNSNNTDKQNTSDTSNNNTQAPAVYNFDTLSINDVTFNDQKILMPNNDFKQYFKVDSSKTDVWDCGNPFVWLDKQWMEKTYGKFDSVKGTFKKFDDKITTFFVGNSEFSSNNNTVLFDASKAKGNKLAIPNSNIILDENTTVDEFKRLFPKITFDPLEEPGVQTARISLSKDNSEGWMFSFKNNKLEYYTLWWELC